MSSPTKKDNPGGGTEAINNQNNPGRDTAKSTKLVGHTVEKQLDKILWELVRGDIELNQLTPALAGLWTVAYFDGLEAGKATADAAVRAQVDRLEHLASLWYFVACNPGKTAADYRRNAVDAAWAEAAA